MNPESDNNTFRHSFDISRDIPHFKHMPDYIQANVAYNIIDVIYESFIVSGDQDYLMSRLLAQKGLPRGFYWAASQTIEKYLKTFLLMNGESVKKFKSHSIKALFKAVSNIDPSISDFNILPHRSILVDTKISRHLKTFTTMEFIDDIEKHGNANNRYNTFGIEFNTGHLYAMDSLVFKLRKKIELLPINESFKSITPDLVMTFENNNPWFQQKGSQSINHSPSEEFKTYYSGNVTKLEILMNNKNNHAYKIALQWLDEKMKLPSIYPPTSQ